MQNRVTVTIADQDYTLLADGDEAYTQKVAAHVDGKIQEVLSAARISLADAAILAALNLTEDYFKEVEASERLRAQLKEYLEESNKLKLELSEAKREIFALQNKK